MNSDRIALINWLKWVRKVSPELYVLFKIQHPEIINALGEQNLGFWSSINWGSVANTAMDFVGKALPIYQQNRQFKQQLELAKVQARAPAGFTTQPVQQQVVAQPVQQQIVAQQQPKVVYVPKAVPPSTPATTTPAPVTPKGEVLEIRIDKGQVDEVKQEVKKEKQSDMMKTLLPVAVIGGALLLAN